MASKPPKRRKSRKSSPRSRKQTPSPPSPRRFRLPALAVVAGGVLLLAGWLLFRKGPLNDAVPDSHRLQTQSIATTSPNRGLSIERPFDGSLFPPEIASPSFKWSDATPKVDCWTIAIEFAGGAPAMQFESTTREWTPAAEAWEEIKRSSSGTEATVTICGIDRRQEETLSSDAIKISTSGDEVGAPIFYREVNLPFREAVRNPAAYIRWRLGSISTEEQPPIVMEKMPMCGNCHSFSQDGSLIGMDVDYGNDKGSYVLCPVSEEMVYDNAKIITWNDYAKEDQRETLGFLSRVSPDGRYVLSTVKDRSVFAAVDNLAFSQLFFPIQGILAYYDRQEKTFHALPGADDKRFVQTNGVWSPDGKYIVFARSEGYHSEALDHQREGLSRAEDVAEFLIDRKTFKYDLWRIPFNEGKGGTPERLAGASANGMSNYFPKYSPDGKWIVFCQAKSYMLLQADSELHIIPAEGGKARRLECNTKRMNSWHSWSPNSKWLVFSSKIYSPYTQLFLTHVDEQGHTSPPVLLSRFTSNTMAANIPEFVSIPPNGIRSIRPEFLDDEAFFTVGKRNIRDNDHDLAIRNFEKALEINPDNTEVRLALGAEYLNHGRLDEAQSQFEKVLSRSPTNKDALWFRAALLEQQGHVPEAIEAYQQILQIDPEYAAACQALGRLALKTGNRDAGRKHLLDAAKLDPENASPYIDLANTYLQEGDMTQAVGMYRLALERAPDSDKALIGLAAALLQLRRPEDIEEAVRLATRACTVTGNQSVSASMVLAEAYSAAGRPEDAVAVARRLVQQAEKSGNTKLLAAVLPLLKRYEQQAGLAAPF